MRDHEQSNYSIGLSRRSLLVGTGATLGVGSVLPSVALAQDESPVEAGVDEGIAILEEEYGVEVTDEEREEAIESATQAAETYPDADDEQIIGAVAGAMVGTFQDEVPENPEDEEPEELEPPAAPDGSEAQEEEGDELEDGEAFQPRFLQQGQRQRSGSQIAATLHGGVRGCLSQYQRIPWRYMFWHCWSGCRGCAWWYQRLSPRYLFYICRGVIFGCLRGFSRPGGWWWYAPWRCCYAVIPYAIQTGITDLRTLESLAATTGEETMETVVEDEIESEDEIGELAEETTETTGEEEGIEEQPEEEPPEEEPPEEEPPEEEPPEEEPPEEEPPEEEPPEEEPPEEEPPAENG